MKAAEKYPKQRYIKVERLVLVKERAGFYKIPENITTSEAAYDTIMEVLHLDEEPQEVFGFLSLNTKHKVTGVDKVSIGSLDASIVHPREIFKRALIKNVSAILLFHNHPSGDPTPSPEDKGVTKRLAEAGKLLGIDVLDHIVCGDDGRFTSLRSMQPELFA